MVDAITFPTFSTPVTNNVVTSSNDLPADYQQTSLQRAQDNNTDDKKKQPINWTAMFLTLGGLLGTGITWQYFVSRAYGEGGMGDLRSGEMRFLDALENKVKGFLEKKDYSDKSHKEFDTHLIQNFARVQINKSAGNWFTRFKQYYSIGKQSEKGKALLEHMVKNITPEFLEDIYAHLEKNKKLAHQDPASLASYKENIAGYGKEINETVTAMKKKPKSKK